MKKNLKKALKIANDLFPDYYDTSGNYRCYHFAFIFKRNKLISIGVNRPRKPDAKALYFGSKFNVHKFKKFNFYTQNWMLSKDVGVRFILIVLILWLLLG